MIWFFKTVLGKRVVMVVHSHGDQEAKVLDFTEGGKAFVKLDKDRVGFLDNSKQKEGEFRKGVSVESLVRWFDI